MKGWHRTVAIAFMTVALSACARSVPPMQSALGRVGDDRAVEYPGITVATEAVGDEYHHERIVLTAGDARWCLLVERNATIWRMPECLVVVDHWGSDVADCWVLVPATVTLWHLTPRSERFDHLYLHPEGMDGGRLTVALRAHGGGQEFEGTVASVDLASGKACQVHPEEAVVVVRRCAPGELEHR